MPSSRFALLFLRQQNTYHRISLLPWHKPMTCLNDGDSLTVSFDCSMCHFHDTCSHVETSRVKACKMVDTAMQVKSSVVQEIRKAYYGEAQAKQCHKEMRKIC